MKTLYSKILLKVTASEYKIHKNETFLFIFRYVPQVELPLHAISPEHYATLIALTYYMKYNGLITVNDAFTTWKKVLF